MIWLGKKIEAFVEIIEQIRGKKIEAFAMLLYTFGHFIMAIFHEPWYDEAVAWQIARCATIKDILFEIPHYEGHPPLWHLILLPFAKLGAPYELSLTITSFIFAGSAVALIIWKSPFPRIIRLLIPFTYFFFYQYGVISRPYCVMMLAFVLLAMSYYKRNEKPGRYTMCLFLLCLTSAYGIVIAGGIAIVWMWEIWNKQNVWKFVKSFKEDKRIWFLALLLALALVLICEIMPREDTFATNLKYENKNSWLITIAYAVFAMLPDTLVTSLYSEYNILQIIDIPTISLVMVSMVGILMWILILIYGWIKNTMGLFVLPYLMFAIFSASIYISPHHIGIALLFFSFWIWISKEVQITKAFSLNLEVSDLELVKSMLLIVSSITMIISVYWTLCSCAYDVEKVYAVGREEAQFIKENNLDDYNIMIGWDVYYDDNNDLESMDINHCYLADNIGPYFENNIFFNFNDGKNNVNYTTHRCASMQETEKRIEKWKEIKPDILFMNPELEIVYDELSIEEYTLVYSELCSRIWKGNLNYGRAEIYVRNDLLNELGLQKVKRAYPPGWEILGEYLK